MDPQPTEETERIVCLPQRSNWAGFWLLLFLAAMIYALLLIPRGPNMPPMTPHERLGIFAAVSVLGLPCVGGAIWMVFWMQRAAIIADSEKICWRGVRKIYAARWEDVVDFHCIRVKSSLKYKVETNSGRLTFGGAWTNEKELAAFIIAHATHCGATDWGVRGSRSNDAWPRFFRYDTKGNRWAMPTMIGLGLIYSAAMLLGKSTDLSRVGKGFTDIQATYGWPMTVLLIVTTLLMALMMPLMFGAMMFPMWRDARRRSNESIEATRQGLSWTDGTRCIDANWDEVRAFYSRPGTDKHFAQPINVVETRSGNFDFTSGISGRELLKRTIETEATQAQIADWRIGQSEAAERPIEHGGARIYHYRTPMNRAFLWFVGAYALMPLGGAWLLNMVNAPIEEIKQRPLPWLATLIGAAVLGWSWWRFRRAAIRVDESGIAQSTFRGVRYLTWEKVTKYFRTPESYLINVEGMGDDGRKIRVQFWISIGDAEGLRAEIERRAINSHNQGWAEETLLPKRPADNSQKPPRGI